MRAAALAAGAVAFVVLATANSGGYRYGVSDQAYYLPAVALAANPDLFPRDRSVLATQTGLMAADDALAALATVSGLDLPAVFLVAYLTTLLLLYAVSVAFARTLGLSWWATAAALLLLTLRHRIARTGANSLEGYMHPRQLAFAMGVAAWVCFLRGRTAWAVAATVLAALVHPTTAVWFGASIAVAWIVQRQPRRAVLAALGAAGVAVAAWALVAGPMTGRVTTMDAAWLAVLADKDYLFPADWPAYAWLANLSSALVVWLVFKRRRRAGAGVDREAAFVWGLGALVLAFVVSVPLTEWRLALAVQLQVSRIFWLLDFAVAVSLAWWLCGPGGVARRARVVVAVLALVSTGRGVYLLTVEHAERGLVAYTLPPTPWIDAMTWISGQATSWHVLADPDHGWKYGVSVRAAALRDTALETGKDSAMAMYDRQVAMRVAERLAALSGFDRLTTTDIRALDDRYGFDVAVVERARPLDLPVLYQNEQFVVYDLR